MILSEDKLLSQWTAQHSPDAFAEITARHAGMVYGVCRRLLGDGKVAEDAAQACFYEAAQTKAVVRKPLCVWLHSLAVQHALQHGHAASAKESREISRPDVSRWDELRCIVDATLDTLPDKWSEPLILRFLEGQMPAAVAQVMDIPREAVEQRLEKGLESLRRSLDVKGTMLPAPLLTALLAANAVEPCPSSLAASLTRLTLPEEVLGTSNIDTAVGGKSRLRVVILWSSGLVMAFLAILLVWNARAKSPANPDTPPAPAIAAPAAPVAPTPVKKAPDPVLPDPVDEKPPSVEPTAPSALDIVRAALIKKLDADRGIQRRDWIPISSKDISADNAIHFFLLAAELFPEADPRWLAAQWKDLAAGGAIEDPELRSFLEACQESFQAIHDGVRAANRSWPVPRGPGEPRPYLPTFKMLSAAMSLQAGMFAAEAKIPEALNLYFEEMAFASQAAQGASIENGLTALEMIRQSLNALNQTLQLDTLPAEQYHEIIKELQRVDSAMPKLWDLAGMDAQVLSDWGTAAFPDITALRRCVQENTSDTAMLAALNAMPDSALQEALQTVLQAQADIGYLALLYPQTQRDLTRVSEESTSLLAAVTPRFFQLPVQEAQAHACLDGQILTTAITWFGMENGRYPVSLDELTPSYIAGALKDPFTMAGYYFQPTASGFILCAAGPDMQMQSALSQTANPRDLILQRD